MNIMLYKGSQHDFARGRSCLTTLLESFEEVNERIGIVVGRGGALVESTTFNRRVVGSIPCSSRHVGTLGKSFTYGCMCASV